jgi:hypothetical protein
VAVGRETGAEVPRTVLVSAQQNIDELEWSTTWGVEKMKRGKTEPDFKGANGMVASPAMNTSRRQFTKTIAVIAATPLLPRLGTASPLGRGNQPGAVMTPELAGTPAESSAGRNMDDESAVQAQDADKPTPDAEALAEVVRIRYGKNLSDDQIAEVKRSINGRIRTADRLKQFKLANGDEPAFVFSADPDGAA